jgi:hypothetical protein
MKAFIALLLLYAPLPAGAVLIDFEDATGLGNISTFYAPLGVTMNGIANPYQQGCPGGGACPLYTGAFPAPATLPAITGGVYSWSFSAEGTTVAVGQSQQVPDILDGGILLSFAYDVATVSLNGKDAGLGLNDAEYVTLTAYNAAGNRIAQTFWTNMTVSPGVQVTPATISSDGIRYVAFNYTNTGAGWFAIDDLQFSTVPLPGALGLLLVGLGMLGGFAAQRKR